MKHFLGWGTLATALSFWAACGGSSSSDILAAESDGGASSSSSGSSGASSSSGASDDGGPSTPACPPGKKTTLRGKLYDPAGANPVAHAFIYVPKGPLPPLADSTKTGVTCGACSDVALGSTAARTMTDAKGEFVLEDVPVGKDVELVAQVGKWRRRELIDIDEACAENVMPDHLLRLPRKSAEGDMPHIAVTSGACDALECMLRGIGIDDSEFVAGHVPAGHVHVFRGSGGKLGADADTDLWNDAAKLKKYDAVLLSCECAEYMENKGGATPGARGAMRDYLDAGGRVFATHYQYTWFRYSPSPEFQGIATWADGSSPDGVYDVATSFPKGNAFATWLKETGASTIAGQIPLKAVRASVGQLNSPGTAWISHPQNGPKQFTFNTPIGGASTCGRAVFSDIHITDTVGPSAIASCPILPGGLSGQQKALEFLLFDALSCVQDDALAPVLPTK